MTTEVHEQLRLDVEVPRSWHLKPTEVHAGVVWLPRCREALQRATEVQPPEWSQA